MLIMSSERLWSHGNRSVKEFLYTFESLIETMSSFTSSSDNKTFWIQRGDHSTTKSQKLYLFFTLLLNPFPKWCCDYDQSRCRPCSGLLDMRLNVRSHSGDVGRWKVISAAHYRPGDDGHVCSRNQRVTHRESRELRGWCRVKRRWENVRREPGKATDEMTLHDECEMGRGKQECVYVCVCDWEKEYVWIYM